ncbi:fluoride efflux transporter FluC [Actinophytocola xanthii]|uniref:Fluoride-specific ion channel FluC n=1 Tax=Actinophytocola xanthii TaxID=1912961 RepID=A0A1Q8CQE4_9PSEU|nr:CrcB family protein [Actinophytocola xanthii]OLF16584.1 chromosome condensation protein CrcB [Actinophytocola xanthii]
MTALLVLLGGAVGAPLRYLVGIWANRALPWGTLLVNVAGSALLGALGGLGTAVPGPLAALLGAGFCGALTTYSTFGLEVVTLVERRRYLAAAGYVLLSVGAAVGAAALAHALVA